MKLMFSPSHHKRFRLLAVGNVRFSLGKTVLLSHLFPASLGFHVGVYFYTIYEVF